MSWVRMHPYVANWPGGGGPPVFEINADENGTAVVELAWDPQALAAPSVYPEPLRYYSSDRPFSAATTRDDGSPATVSVPAQTITLTANRATWTVPAPLWEAIGQETLKSVSTPPRSTFARCLYYRVRLTPPGGNLATVWPVDATITGASAASAPHIGVLPLSGSVGGQILPDSAAVKGLGGILLFPTLWADMVEALWKELPAADPGRKALEAIFAHPAFRGATLPERTDVLRVWLFSNTMRRRVPELLSRQTVVGSGVTQPIMTKQALRGGRTLVALLLDLLVIRPHPEMGAVTRDDLIDDVLREVLDPNGQLNQGQAGTCVPTSIQTLLITVNPAEYVRLQTGFLSAAGRAELANGTTADVPRGALQPARYTTTITLPDGSTVNPTNLGFAFRTFAEMAFQSAMMKLGRGAEFPPDNGTEQAAQQMFATCYRGGLTATQAKRVLDPLFNVPFTISTEAWPPPFSPSPSAVQQAVTASLLSDLDTRGQQMLIATYWAVPPWTTPPPPTWPAHAVLALRRGGGRLFFKNPQYAASAPGLGLVNGGTASNPPRRYEDVSGSIESISEADLARWVLWYLVPTTALI